MILYSCDVPGLAGNIFTMIVSHDLPHEEAVDFMKNIRRYFYAGWQNVLGIEVLKKNRRRKIIKD